MKNLIDYDQKEIQHKVKYHVFYQVLSYALFVLMIFFMFLWTVEKDSSEYYKGMLQIQDSCYTNALQEQKLSIDTAKWYREMGVKFEKDFDN